MGLTSVRSGAPIERLFAKLKALLAKAAARTKNDSVDPLAACLDACPQTECAHYLDYCG